MTQPATLFSDDRASHRGLREKLTNRPRLYLAGKVHKEQYRWNVADWAVRNSPSTPASVDGFAFEFVGPFTDALSDHGCWTGDSLHSVNRERVLERSLAGILRANVVVASLIDNGAFGTVFELGFAYANRPSIVIAREGQKFTEAAWMAVVSATAVVWADSAREGLLKIFTAATAGRYGGHPSYREYLKSDHWARRRAEALLRFGNKCALCGSAEELNVHHNTYERLGREAPTDLVVLCREHHEKFHDILPDAKASSGER